MQNFAAIVSLGCSKNLVDSETLAPQLVNCGYTLTADASKASLILINTCGFLESAVQEAIQTILEFSAFKDTAKCRALVVTGCMVQRYGKKLLHLLPEVDIFLGTSHYLALESILKGRQQGNPQKLWIDTPRRLLNSQTPRLRSTAKHMAYLKIADGCSNHCSFCKIPQLRGSYRSRSIEDVSCEATRLAAEGVKEINLIAQDTTAFGSDHGDEGALLRLLEVLDEIPGIEWVRLLYTYPERVDTNLLRTIFQSRRILHYLDIPFQHCVPKILKKMRRSQSPMEVQTLLDLIRNVIPDISLRTSLIVGFPGETEADFMDLVRFVETAQFDHLGVFAFSAEQGTQAAKFTMQIDKQVKEERLRTIMDVQRSISRRRLKRFVGKIVPILLEGHHPETDFLLSGRLQGQAPEVDGSVIITKGEGHLGEIMLGRIRRVHDYDVEAELVTTPENRIN